MGGMAGLFQDQQYDEYGLAIPKKDWTGLAADALAPDPDDAWYEELGKGVGAIPAVLGGHFLDQMPIIGGPAMGPLNDLAHEGENLEYQRQRAAVEEAQKMYAPEPTYEWMTD